MPQLLERFTASGDGDDYVRLGYQEAELYANAFAAYDVHTEVPPSLELRRHSLAPYVGKLGMLPELPRTARDS